MNQVVLIGRLTKDPEIRYAQNGNAQCIFTLAVDRRLSREKKRGDDGGGETHGRLYPHYRMGEKCGELCKIPIERFAMRRERKNRHGKL